jgi:hypothetical protein
MMVAQLGPRRFRGRNMPLSLTDDEMSLVLALAEPIDHKRRPEFLAAVAAELAACEQTGSGSASCIGYMISNYLFGRLVKGEPKARPFWPKIPPR